MHTLANSMTLPPRSPTVIKWVNDWRKLLMVGWALWPLRSCQVSISENQKFYQSSKNVRALGWISPPGKGWSQQDVPFLLPTSCLCSRFILSALPPGTHHSWGWPWVVSTQREGIWEMNSDKGMERPFWRLASAVIALWSGGVSFNLSEPHTAYLWDEKTHA